MEDELMMSQEPMPEMHDVYDDADDVLVSNNAPAVPPSMGMDFLPDPDPIEEDALTIFMRGWNAKLELKRAAEFEHEKAMRAKALEDMKNWNHQRDIRLTAKKETNRNEEKVLTDAISSEAENLKVWDRVSKLIDSNTEPIDSKGADVTRMRKLFIQLKNEPLEQTRMMA